MASPSQKTKEKVTRFGKATRDKLHHHGFHVPGWIQLLIWTIGVIVFAGLTFNSSWPLISNYLNDDKNVAVQTTIFMNKSFPPPQFVLRVPHSIYDERGTALGILSEHVYNNETNIEANCSVCRRLARANWDVWRDPNVRLSKTDHFDTVYSLTGAIIRKLLRSAAAASNNGTTAADAFDALEPTNSDWNGPILDASLIFIDWQFILDRYFEVDANSDSLSKAIEAINIEFANQRTVNGTKVLHVLRARVFRALCQRMTLNLTISYPGRRNEQKDRTPTTTASSYCEDIMTKDSAGYPIIFDNDSLWIPLPILNSDVECRFDGTLLPDSNNNTNTTITMWAPNGGEFDRADRIWLHTDPLPLLYSEIDDDNNYWWSAVAGGYRRNGRSPYMLARYGALMQMQEGRKNKETSCNREISPKVCVEKCGKRWTVEYCGCVPYTFEKALPSSVRLQANGTTTTDDVPTRTLPYCTRAAYNACDPIGSYNRTGARKRCVEECSNPCEYTSYNYNVYTDEYAEIEPSGFTVILRPMNSDPIVQFANTTKDSVDDFVAAIGGVIGLYLGLHCVSLLTFFINLVEYTRKYVIRRRKNQKRRKTLTWGISIFRMAATMNSLFVVDEQHMGGKQKIDGSVKEEEREEPASLKQEVKALKNELARMKMTLAALDEREHITGSSENNDVIEYRL